MPLLLLGYLDETPLLKHLVAELNDALVVVHDIRKHASLLLLLQWGLKGVIFNGGCTFTRQIGLSLQALLGDSKGVMVVIHNIRIFNRDHQLLLNWYLLGRLYYFILKFFGRIQIRWFLLIRWWRIFWEQWCCTWVALQIAFNIFSLKHNIIRFEVPVRTFLKFGFKRVDFASRAIHSAAFFKNYNSTIALV